MKQRHNRIRSTAADSRKRTLEIAAPKLEQNATGLADPRDLFNYGPLNANPIQQIPGRSLREFGEEPT